MSADFSIRRIAPSQAEAYRTLRLEALASAPEAFGSSYEEEIGFPIETTRERIPAAGPNVIFGAFAGSDLVGMAGFVAFDRVKINHKGLLWGVFVKPEWRGQKLGKALVQSVIDHAAEHVLILQAAVGLTNESARRTYYGLGFTPYGIERRALRIGTAFYDEELIALDLAQRVSP